jgi:hypothetical protein
MVYFFLCLLGMHGRGIDVKSLEKQGVFDPCVGFVHRDKLYLEQNGVVVIDLTSQQKQSVYQHPGNGPGEHRALAGFMPVGRQLLLHDSYLRKVIRLSLDELTFQKEQKLDPKIRRVAFTGKHLVATQQITNGKGIGYTLLILQQDTLEPIDTFALDIDLGVETECLVAAIDQNRVLVYPWTMSYAHYEALLIDLNSRVISKIYEENPLWHPSHQEMKSIYQTHWPGRTAIRTVSVRDGQIDVFLWTYPSKEENVFWKHSFSSATGNVLSKTRQTAAPLISVFFPTERQVFFDGEQGLTWD